MYPLTYDKLPFDTYRFATPILCQARGGTLPTLQMLITGDPEVLPGVQKYYLRPAPA